MICGYCGKEIDNDSLFCEYCGGRIAVCQDVNSYSEQGDDVQNDFGSRYAENYGYTTDNGYPVQNNQYAAQGYVNEYGSVASVENTPVKKKSNGAVIGIVVAAVVVVIAVIAAVLIFFGGNNPSPTDTSPTDDYVGEATESVITGHTKILDAYDEGSIFAPEKLYNDVDYYVSCSTAALYKESGGYGKGQIAQLDANDVVTVKGAMEDSDWVYVYCEELDIYGWIEPENISSEMVDANFAVTDKREVVYYEDFKSYEAMIDVGGSKYRLNIRTAPSTDDKNTVIREIPHHETVTVIGVSALDVTWYYVYYDSADAGRIYGFMSSEFLVKLS